MLEVKEMVGRELRQPSTIDVSLRAEDKAMVAGEMAQPESERERLREREEEEKKRRRG